MNYQTVDCRYSKKRLLCINLSKPTATLRGGALEYDTVTQPRDYDAQTLVIFAVTAPKSLLQPRAGFRINKPEAEVTSAEIELLRMDFVNRVKTDANIYIAENLISRIQGHITSGLIGILKGRAMRLDI